MLLKKSVILLWNHPSSDSHSLRKTQGIQRYIYDLSLHCSIQLLTPILFARRELCISFSALRLIQLPIEIFFVELRFDNFKWLVFV